MNTLVVADIFGYMAAGIGIVMFIPQALQVWKTKNTKSISLSTFILFDIASVLWIIYGVLRIAYPVIVVNSVLLFLTTYIVFMKLKYK
jgi:MtN3 and saliva related transmembrane protein